MFEAILTQMINPAHELCRLAHEIDWSVFEVKFSHLYSHTGWSAHPIRRIVGFRILKAVVQQAGRNCRSQVGGDPLLTLLHRRGSLPAQGTVRPERACALP